MLGGEPIGRCGLRGAGAGTSSAPMRSAPNRAGSQREGAARGIVKPPGRDETRGSCIDGDGGKASQEVGRGRCHVPQRRRGVQLLLLAPGAHPERKMNQHAGSCLGPPARYEYLLGAATTWVLGSSNDHTHRFAVTTARSEPIQSRAGCRWGLLWAIDASSFVRGRPARLAWAYGAGVMAGVTALACTQAGWTAVQRLRGSRRRRRRAWRRSCRCPWPAALPAQR